MIKNIKKCLVLAACFGVIGCASPLSIISKPAPLIIDHPARPAPIVLNDVTWSVVTNSNLSAFVANAQKAQGTTDPTFIVLSPDDYNAILANLADIKRYVQQQQTIIAYYEKATSTSTSLSTSTTAPTKK